MYTYSIVKEILNTAFNIKRITIFTVHRLAHVHKIELYYAHSTPSYLASYSYLISLTLQRKHLIASTLFYSYPNLIPSAPLVT